MAKLKVLVLTQCYSVHGMDVLSKMPTSVKIYFVPKDFVSHTVAPVGGPQFISIKRKVDYQLSILAEKSLPL